jgi:small conductance mechanosensitive channel
LLTVDLGVVITGLAPQDRITAVDPQLPPAPLPLATASTTGHGWLEDLLIRTGVDPSTAHTVSEFVIRPLEIIVVVAVAALVARYGARAIRRVLTKMARPATGRSGSPRAEGRVATVVALISNVWRFFVVIVAISIILGMLGVNLTPLLASATVIGATIGFGAQSLVRDYLSGILLTVEDQYGIGDSLTVNDTTGVVEDLSLRVTRLRSPDGTVWYVPNGDIRKLANTSRGWAKAVVDIPVIPGGTEQLARVSAVVAGAARSVAHEARFVGGCTEPPEVLGIVAADAEVCTLRVALRTTPAQRATLERALREATIGALVDSGLWAGPGSEEAVPTGDVAAEIPPKPQSGPGT